MKASIRTPRAQVRGLGSAKHGVGHFIGQRVSAVALLFLVPWFLISLLSALSGGYSTAMMWIEVPLHALCILLTVTAAIYHMRLGMQVVIEDYITRPITRMILLMLNTFFCILLFVVTVYSVLLIAA